MAGGDVGSAVPGGGVLCGVRAGRVWGLQSLVTALVVLAAVPGIGCLPGAGQRHQGNAVGGAGRQAQFAAGTAVGQHLMLKAGGAHDGVDRTGQDALGAANAVQGVDADHMPHGHGLQVCGQRHDRLVEQSGQGLDGGVGARRAAIDGGLAPGDGAGIGMAVVVAAAPALGLGQQPVDGIDQGHGGHRLKGWGHGPIVVIMGGQSLTDRMLQKTRIPLAWASAISLGVILNEIPTQSQIY